MMSIYAAIFNATKEDVAKTRSQYVNRHSFMDYKTFIEPYIKDGRIGFLVCSPYLVHAAWFLDHLAKNMAERLDEEYETPEQLYVDAIFTQVEAGHCSNCGVEVIKGTLIDGSRYNRGMLCLNCNFAAIIISTE